MASSLIISKLEARKQEKIAQLKAKIVRNFGKSLKVFPSMKEKIPTISRTDSDDVRTEKLKERERIFRMQEIEYETRQDELIEELETLITRVKDRNQEVESTYEQQYSASDASNRIVSATLPSKCPECGNDVS
jgi:hypothetical protein